MRFMSWARAAVALVTLTIAIPAHAYNSDPWHLVGYGDVPGAHIELDAYGSHAGVVVWLGQGTGTLTLVKDGHVSRRRLIVDCVDVTGDAQPDTFVAGTATDTTGQEWSFRMYIYEDQEEDVWFELRPGTDDRSCQAGYFPVGSGRGSFTVNAPLLT
jgi:hypothetical protein